MSIKPILLEVIIKYIDMPQLYSDNMLSSTHLKEAFKRTHISSIVMYTVDKTDLQHTLTAFLPDSFVYII